LPPADKDTSLKICWPSAAAALSSLDELVLVPPSPPPQPANAMPSAAVALHARILKMCPSE
jgi:hypothetical protein